MGYTYSAQSVFMYNVWMNYLAWKLKMDIVPNCESISAVWRHRDKEASSLLFSGSGFLIATPCDFYGVRYKYITYLSVKCGTKKKNHEYIPKYNCPNLKPSLAFFFRAVERRGDVIFKYSPNESLLLDSRKKIGKSIVFRYKNCN